VDEIERQIDCTKLESAVQHFFFLPSYCHFFQYLCLSINISR